MQILYYILYKTPSHIAFQILMGILFHFGKNFDLPQIFMLT